MWRFVQSAYSWYLIYFFCFCFLVVFAVCFSTFYFNLSESSKDLILHTFMSFDCPSFELGLIIQINVMEISDTFGICIRFFRLMIYLRLRSDSNLKPKTLRIYFKIFMVMGFYDDAFHQKFQANPKLILLCFLTIRNLKWFLDWYIWLTSTRIIEDVYDSLLPNKDIDNTFSNDLAEIHFRKTENFKNTLIDNYLVISSIKATMANVSRYNVTR